MMEEIKKIKSDKKDLRRFAISLGSVMAVWGLLFLSKGRNFYWLFFAVSMIFVFLGIVLPFSLKPIQRLGMVSAVVLGAVVTRVILIILFYATIFPIGVLLNVFGKDTLNRGWNRKADSYWLSVGKLSKEQYEKQF